MTSKVTSSKSSGFAKSTSTFSESERARRYWMTCRNDAAWAAKEAKAAQKQLDSFRKRADNAGDAYLALCAPSRRVKIQ